MERSARSIRRLCSLGLTAHQLIPAVLKCLHDVIESDANSYIWLDKHGQISDIYDEREEVYSLLPAYLSEYLGSKESEFFVGWKSAAKYPRAVDIRELWHSGNSELNRHEFYNTLIRATNFKYGIQCVVRVGGFSHGIIMLRRTPQDSDFVFRDMQALDRIASCIGHALEAPQNQAADEYALAHSREGFINAWLDGTITDFSVGAERLYLLANGSSGIYSFESVSTKRLTPVFAALIQRFSVQRQGFDNTPPAQTIENLWGRFRLSAFPMKVINLHESKPSVFIRIEYFETSIKLIFERTEEAPLTSRQKEICIAIGLGKQYEQIAEELGIALSTVVSHKKELFNRLGVSDRHALVRRLLYQT